MDNVQDWSPPQIHGDWSSSCGHTSKLGQVWPAETEAKRAKGTTQLFLFYHFLSPLIQLKREPRKVGTGEEMVKDRDNRQQKKNMLH